MPDALLLIPRVAIMIGGAAAGLLASFWRASFGRAGTGRAHSNPVRLPAGVPAAVAVQYTQLQARLSRLENLVEAHEEKLRDVPATRDIIAAMNQVFERSATALDERFAEQARSIEALKLMVSQTDELLEKVLDSIYSLPESPRDPDAERPLLQQ